MATEQENTRDRLRRVPLFAGLDERELDRLIGLSRILRFKKKDMLFSEDDPYQGMFVVLTGLAVVYKLSDEGRMLILHVCRPDASIAEVPLFDPDPDVRHSAHARATRESDVLFLPKEKFAPFLRQHPEVAWEMLKSLAHRMRELTEQLEGITLREVTSRLARYLLAEIDTAGIDPAGPIELTLPLAKSALASFLGTVHETLSRTLARLVKDKVIEVDGPRVKVLDLPWLKRLA